MNFAARRRRVLDALGADGALVLAASPELRVGRDTELRYLVDADVRYLTGYEEPEAVLVLCPSNDDGAFTMFVRPRDAAQELWTGPRGGPEAAVARFGADAAYPIAELADRLPALLGATRTVYARLRSGNVALDEIVARLPEKGRARRARLGAGIEAIVEPGVILDDLRLIKDGDEVAAIRAAVDVSVDAFRTALRGVRTAATEAQIEARLEAEFRWRGASGPAFPSIVAGGANATVLHYVRNDARLDPTSLVLIDAGARVDGYCGDLTRTVPVSGKWSDAQGTLYDIVLAARRAALAAIRPGSSFDDVHDAAITALAAGLHEAGIVRAGSDADQLDATRRFFPHRTSHWLGLDVHDVGDYQRDGRSRVLEAGMVLTVEPGLYMPQADDVPDEFRGSGIRVEDDVLVTADGMEVLSAALPVDRAALQALVEGS